MAEISKQALKVENNTQFPNNNNGQITPSRLRGFNTDMIDSLVDEISYNADSASFNQRILELDPSASAEAINNLELFSASADARLDALEAATSSYANSASVAAVDNAQNQRLNSLESFTASLDVTYVTQTELAAATGALQNSIDTKLNTSSFNAFTQSYINASASFDSRVDALEAFSTSLDTNFASQTEFNAFTQSIDGRVDSIESFTASIAGTNAFTQSANQRLNSIEAQSGSWVTAAITASSLITASFNNGTRNLTFTKGDNSTFAVNIPDITGSILPAGTISGSQQITNLGFVSSSITASTIVTASANNATITFTKGDASTFSVTVATGSAVSASYAENAATASFARDVIVSAINANQSTLPIGTVVRISGATGDNPRFNTASYDSEANSSNTLGILANTAVSGDYADITVIGKVIGVNTAGMNAGDLIYLSSSGQFTNVAPQAPLNIVTLGEVLRVQSNNGSIFVNVSNGWELNELHNVRIVSEQQGDVLVYEASSSLWKNQPSSSFAKADTFNAFTASQQLLNARFATTGSNLFDGSNTFINGLTTFFTPIVFQNTSGVQNYSGSAITFGLSSTTGSNYTLKSNPFEPVLLITRESDNAKPIQMDWRDNKVTLAESGAVEIAPSAFGGFKVNTTASFYGRNVWMIADGFTSSLAYVTASVSGSNSNLIFKNNALTTATIVSGSSNIFQSPGAATATFNRYVGGGNNIFITSGSVPQLTGSLSISPVMNANIINGAGTIFMRTPVSSSAYTISHNTINGGNINFGSAAATSFVSASAGLNFTNNFSNATIQAVANKTTLVNAPNIQLNNLGGALVLNMDSSSIGFASNNLQGNLTINNLYSGSTAAGNFVSVANGLFVGSNYSLVASGSNTTLTTPRQFANNVMLGSAHSASANLLGDNSNLNSVALIGHGLNVTGSSALQTAATQAADRGTVIVGRFNTDVLSNNTVFVVGTGTSTSSRRNGLLIDSGSNAFLSGSLNVAGDSSFTGSMNFLSGSASGSVVTNVGDTFTGTAAVTKIISLSSAEYLAIVTKDPNTLYIIV
jgi:hypothetical protein